MTISFHSLMAIGVAVAIGVGAGQAAANPRPLPFTYGYETLGAGETEIEQYVDFTPIKAQSNTTGELAWYGATQFQTEYEAGITDRLELGLYVTFVPRPGSAFNDSAVPTLPEGNGVKQRLRLRLAEEGDLPVDIGLYGEIVENEREIELEAKIILQKRFGDLKIAANLTTEREFYFDGVTEWVVQPSVGLTYEVVPAFHPGLEAWVISEYPTPAPAQRAFNLGPHTFVGPAAMVSLGQLWWSTGVYLRVNDFGATPQSGDAYGNLWMRTIVGIGL